MNARVHEANLRKVNTTLAELPFDTKQPPTLSDDGLCQLEFNDGFPIVLELSPEGETLASYAMIFELPNDPSAKHYVYEQLLKLNVYQPFVGGGTLAIDPQGACVLYSHCVATDTLTTDVLNAHFNLISENVAAVRAKFELDQEAEESL